ncbi:MAG: nucleotide excision repair helicase, Xpb1 [Candidatus Aramenus sulfurataquae]|jgi:superfamily II DNA or RNA helicase|uniref:DEAD/DEAH box helicase n=2 Tax=Candidatus Aramenus sulfurataquae TaxID=1326980 RepID=W7KIE2_9CREN|nr:MAG: nucleotide excision repair helicase, Xpb1 [Candidatus Aramenus sulfurataquae]MCL7344090.1 DEAD/DEAH box helicase [Candidatus Aramenus sulfurataquae]
MFSKTFYLRRWLDEETFSRLLTFSRFLGRDSNGSQFALDIERARRNRVRLSEIKSTLEELGVELTEDEVSYLAKALPEYDVEFQLVNGKLYVIPRVYVMDIIKRAGLHLTYDRQRKVFETYPYYYPQLKKIFIENGLKVKELTLGFKEFELELNVNLRDYQQEAINKWKKNDFKGVIALPTGAGKTVVGIKAIEEVKRPTLIVTFTREQMLQWRDTLIRFSAKRPELGLFYSAEKTIKPITISTYQTAFRHIAELSDKFELVVIDEVHHLPAEKFKEIALGLIAEMRLGLSATPYRDDGKHVELFKLMGGVIYYRSVDELIGRGYLSPYEIVQIKVYLTPEERKRYFELLKKFNALAKGRKVSELVKMAKDGDEKAIEALKLHNEIKKIVGFAQNKMAKIKEILEKEKGKVLIFTQYVEQAEEIAKAFNGLLITGKMSKAEREKVLKAFKFMKSGILVLTTVGDEGLDIPDANVGIIVTGTGSRRQFIQRLGRLLRPYEGKKALLYEILVRGTPEEYQAKRRKEQDLTDILLQMSSEYPDDKK